MISPLRKAWANREGVCTSYGVLPICPGRINEKQPGLLSRLLILDTPEEELKLE